MNKIFLMVKLLSILTFAFSLSGCIQTNPSHRASITGNIITNVNAQGNLCFAPDFSTATLMNKSVEDRLKFIKLSSIQLRDNEVVKNSKVIWSVVPNAKNVYNLKNKQSICMNQSYESLKLQKDNILKPQIYTISLYGMDDTNSYNVRFNDNFEYSIQKK